MALGIARPAAMAPSGRRRSTIIIVLRAPAASAFAAPIIVVAGTAAGLTLILAGAASTASILVVAALGSMSVLPAPARRFRMTFGVAKPAAASAVVAVIVIAADGCGARLSVCGRRPDAVPVPAWSESSPSPGETLPNDPRNRQTSRGFGRRCGHRRPGCGWRSGDPSRGRRPGPVTWYLRRSGGYAHS